MFSAVRMRSLAARKFVGISVGTSTKRRVFLDFGTNRLRKRAPKVQRFRGFEKLTRLHGVALEQGTGYQHAAY